MNKSKPAKTTYPMYHLLVERWSPVGFDERPVEPEQVGSLLEAARWAPSSYNEQPWRLILAQRSDGDARAALEESIVPANLEWCSRADLLLLVCAKRVFTRSGEPNRHATYDCGQAITSLTLQAQSMGLIVHQMGGFDPERARERLGIPEPYEPLVMVAIGHPADPEDLPEGLRQRDALPRQRLDLSAIAFHGRFGDPFAL